MASDETFFLWPRSCFRSLLFLLTSSIPAFSSSQVSGEMRWDGGNGAYRFQ